jgi:hypothetical protein
VLTLSDLDETKKKIKKSIWKKFDPPMIPCVGFHEKRAKTLTTTEAESAPTIHSFHNRSFPGRPTATGFFFHSRRDYVMLPGVKQRIARLPFMNRVRTIVRPSRFGLVIRASSGTSIHWLVVEMDAVMAVFGIPVRIGDRTVIHESAALPLPARQMIESAFKLGMVSVVG